MVTVAIRALEVEYLVTILDWGQSRSRYIVTDSDSDSTALVHTTIVLKDVCLEHVFNDGILSEAH
jgi:hypothetical protein